MLSPVMVQFNLLTSMTYRDQVLMPDREQGYAMQQRVAVGRAAISLAKLCSWVINGRRDQLIHPLWFTLLH